jgi:hypothetical protein
LPSLNLNSVKIEQAIVLCLLKNKHVSLKGIGTFTINQNFPEHPDPEKLVNIPPDAIDFTYDPRTREDDELVNFIVQNSTKIKPLASADVESFLTLGREFLNIGNPFTIHGLGYLEKSNSGQVQFVPGHLIMRPSLTVPREEVHEPSSTEESESHYGQEAPAVPSNRNYGRLILLVVLFVILGSAVAWYFGFRKNNQPEPNPSETIVPIADSNQNNISKDSLAEVQKKADSSKLTESKNPGYAPSDSFTFKVVVKTTKNKAAALARLQKLENYGRHVIMYTRDSITYKIAHPFMLPLSDTAKVLDSLNRFYYLGRAHIEIK